MVVDGCYRGPDLTEWFSVEPTCAKRYETSSGPEIDGVAGYLGLRFPPGSFRNPRIRWIESQQNRLFCRVLFLAADSSLAELIMQNRHGCLIVVTGGRIVDRSLGLLQLSLSYLHDAAQIHLVTC